MPSRANAVVVVEPKDSLTRIAHNAVVEIRALHDEAQSAAGASRERATHAVQIAWECGRKLVEVKAYLAEQKRAKRGAQRGVLTFEDWFGANEKALGFGRRTAFKYMALSKVHHGALGEDAGLRQAYLKLGIVPSKTRGKEKHRISVRVLPYLTWTNELTRWVMAKRKAGAKAKDMVDLRQLYAELHAIFGKAA